MIHINFAIILKKSLPTNIRLRISTYIPEKNQSQEKEQNTRLCFSFCHMHSYPELLSQLFISQPCIQKMQIGFRSNLDLGRSGSHVSRVWDNLSAGIYQILIALDNVSIGFLLIPVVG